MKDLNTEKESLSNGCKLSAETFNDFVERLNFHSRGNGVDDHYTADALFIVQARRLVTGIDLDYADDKCIYDHESCETYYSLTDFLEAIDEDSLEYYELNDFDTPFLEMTESDQWDCLGNISALTISGWFECWEYVNSHFTKEAAKSFIKRKSHDYGNGLRVYVDSQYWCWEFNTIKNAILDGKLVYKD